MADLTEQLGREADRHVHPRSASPFVYQSIDRSGKRWPIAATVAQTRDRSLAHYDHKKLLAGVGLLTSLFAVSAAVPLGRTAEMSSRAVGRPREHCMYCTR